MNRINVEPVSFIAVIALALTLRLWGIGYDLPHIYHPDEPGYIAISQNIFKTGDLNPHFFNYPSLFFYINALAYVPYYLAGTLSGVFHAPGDIASPLSLAMGVSQTQMPTTVLMGRLITMCFGIGSAALVFLIGTRLAGKAVVGMFAAFMMAVSPAAVRHSQLVTPDTLVVFFALASVWASVLVCQEGKTWQYAMGGICVGLTISSKYNGALVLLPLLLAHLLRCGRAALTDRRLYLALMLCGIGFLVSTPYAMLDSSKFVADLRFEAMHYSSGHAGMEGDSLRWYLDYMWTTTGLICVLAAIEGLRGVYSRSKEIILLAIFALVYLGFISGFQVRNDRTFLPITPFLFLLASSSLVYWFSRIGAFKARLARTLSLAVFTCLTLALLIAPALNTVSDAAQRMTADSRTTARNWIAENIPCGASIAIESYSPFVDPACFSVQGSARMIDHLPEWYAENGFEYLIFSQGMFGRFYREPDKYYEEVAQYDNLFRSLHLLRRFTDGAYEIKVYQVNVE
jgi:4-amino-4-deoxy-L-arabinose transferase-like glycosyltransferase